MINSHEGRSVQTFDVPVAYLHAPLPDDKVVRMEFEGEFVDIICEVNPEYENFVIYEKGKKVLFMLILKAIYGMIEIALLWYDLFSTIILGLGFKLNPYERCISNKFIDEHQCTIRWFVDDNKVSHMGDNVNSMLADNIEENFGKISRKTGKKHIFLGMEIDFIGGKKVTVSTPHHVDEALEDFGETIKGKVVNPATSQLFTIASEAKELDDGKKEHYHSITAKILWIMKRSRPDL